MFTGYYTIPHYKIMSFKVVHILKINELVCMTDNKCVKKLHDDILSITFYFISCHKN